MTQDRANDSLVIDTSTEFGNRVARRLQEDQIAWLTTVGPDLTPQPSPVWFYWDGETALVYSQPQAPKLRNIRERPRVSLHLLSTPSGGDVVILTGQAWIDDQAPAMDANTGYLEKYREGLAALPTPLDQLTQEYSVVVRIRPTGLRGQ
jgi:PPOX class probable F420-dependent enzyme